MASLKGGSGVDTGKTMPLYVVHESLSTQPGARCGTRTLDLWR